MPFAARSSQEKPGIAHWRGGCWKDSESVKEQDPLLGLRDGHLGLKQIRQLAIMKDDSF